MKRILLTITLALATASATVSAAGYPEKPIRLIIPFAAGGASDAAARTISKALSASTGQQIVIDNRAGAYGSIAAQTVLTARPDGYTLLWGVGSMVSIPLLLKKPPFESLATFTPLSTVGDFAYGMFIHPDVPATTVDAFVKHASTQPGALNFAAASLGEYFVTARFMKATGTTMTRIAYKGGAAAMPDLLAGRVQLHFTPTAIALPHVKEARLRMLGIILPQRSPAAPQVPTLIEAGLPDVTGPTWQAIFGPPKLPLQTAQQLNREVHRALQDPEVLAQFERLVLLPGASTPEQLAAAVREGTESWRVFIRENNIPQE